ncbi:SGNH/GDSL hydrolase family protein [Streptomyces zagrosensis]|uniref:Lysophospholipase L1-like esterase n=1 Tax=Streptomyces zagrosensis TaxID=1042984 RepID=A0A7W9UY11_9ACTN|nr:SGNH/GDSL hydrolase family protein [Streptomyces zagrosensis]MBB5935177.1 lysophospholipase L1-like esterase [Streptomyces zagrosensis]
MTVSPLPRRTAYAVLAALAAVVIVVSTAIFVGVGRSDNSAEPASGHGNEAAPASAGNWIGTWSTAPVAAEPRNVNGFPDMSIRNVVRISVGGEQLRIRLSNHYGTRPLTISHASVALAAAPSDPTAAPNTMRRLRFNSRHSVTIPAGQHVISDAARLSVPDASDVLVTTFSPTPSGAVTYHPHARQISYLARGDHAEDTAGLAYTEQSPYWRYLTAVDVWTTKARGSVVVLGDSITDGITSTTGANHRWPDFLAERLRTERGAPRLGVLNQGISGNRILTDGNSSPPHNPSGLTRFDRDVLAHTGVRAVIIQLGVNDILRTPHETNPNRIVGGLRQMVEQAHARGLRVVGGTLMPFYGHRGFTPQLNGVRQAVNDQIRSGEVFDEVVDFDAALRDPASPLRLLPRYDSGDHLHPSDEGFRAMAKTLNLQHLRGVAAATL